MFTVEIHGDRELVLKLSSMSDRVRQALYSKVVSLASELKTYIIDKKLSGQVLNHRTGALWRSIHDEATQSADEVVGRVYSSGVPYAAIHEYGGKTAPHVIEAKNGKALAFMWHGKQAFFTKVNHPGSKMPERSYMRTSLAENQEKIIRGMEEAVTGAMQ